jgi:3-methylcrotonyl-CoA carboxylase alpha subunit
MVIEAMKMEHQIKAPAAARVGSVRFAVGDRVSMGDLLVELEQEDR